MAYPVIFSPVARANFFCQSNLYARRISQQSQSIRQEAIPKLLLYKFEAILQRSRLYHFSGSSGFCPGRLNLADSNVIIFFRVVLCCYI